MAEKYYAICHDEGDDFSLWRDDRNIALLFKTRTDAYNYIKNCFGSDKTHKKYFNCEKATSVEVFRKKDEGWFYRCAIVPCKVFSK